MTDEQVAAAIELPTIEVRIESGPLAGHVLTMRTPSTRMFIQQRRGTWDNLDMFEEILNAIVDHDLGQEPDLLPPAVVVGIGTAWFTAIKEAALPPATGSTSPDL
ncbi:MAG TPA: hypothetical protein VM285_00130 [Polyangia bacterium]|nr:hypothetical protein [Polyangia bacterium]HUW16922.1 hypothetical protein [Actinomycetes bacterium]